MEQRLKLFADVIDSGGFSAAAKRLHISQPAITAAVKKLEKELGTELLNRTGFELSAAGEAAYRAGKRLQADEQNLQSELSVIAGRKPQLRVGLVDSLAEMLFVRSNAYDALQSKVMLSLAIDNSASLLERTANGELDIALVVANLAYPAGVRVVQKLGDEPLVLVAAPEIASVAVTASQSGVLRPFLSYRQESYTYQLIQQYATDAGLALDAQFYATSPSVMLGLALTGKGVTGLPYHMVADHIASGALLPISLNDRHIIKRPFVAITQRGRLLPQGSQDLLLAAETTLRSNMSQARHHVKRG